MARTDAEQLAILNREWAKDLLAKEGAPRGNILEMVTWYVNRQKERPVRAQALEPRKRDFRGDLTGLINRYSKENGSDTPDFLLADFLLAALDAFDHTVRNREAWYGREPKPAPESIEEQP